MSDKLSLQTKELAEFALKADKGNRLLIGHLVKFLTEKGIIDLKEYLSSVEEFKENTKDLLEVGIEAELFEVTCDLHINDFKKPE